MFKIRSCQHSQTIHRCVQQISLKWFHRDYGELKFHAEYYLLSPKRNELEWPINSTTLSNGMNVFTDKTYSDWEPKQCLKHAKNQFIFTNNSNGSHERKANVQKLSIIGIPQKQLQQYSANNIITISHYDTTASNAVSGSLCFKRRTTLILRYPSPIILSWTSITTSCFRDSRTIF